MDQVGSDQVIVYRSTDAEPCRQRTLVLSAAGIACELRREGTEFAVAVAAVDEERGRAEISAYALENPETVPSRTTGESRAGSGWSGAVGFTLVLVLITFLAQRRFLGCDWFQTGKTIAGRIQHGQWWRTVTALTLHADGAHLIANLVVGGVVCVLASQLLGTGMALLSILLAGAAGNLLNAMIRNPEHTSIGASTAVFAGLGLLAAQAWRQSRLRTSKMERWGPVVGGLLLLSFLGTGGERTDVAAHGCGFLCGALAGGSLGARVHDVAPRRGIQGVCGLVALLMIAAAWWIALAQCPPG